MYYIVGGFGSHAIFSARQLMIGAETRARRREPMRKISFSGLDSGQYSNVEPPGIAGLDAASAAINGLWCSAIVHVTIQLMMPVRAAR